MSKISKALSEELNNYSKKNIKHKPILKYKVGDIIRIKTAEKMKEEYDSSSSIFNPRHPLSSVIAIEEDARFPFTSCMEQKLNRFFSDRILTIKTKESSFYIMENIDGQEFWNGICWEEWMIEKKIIIEPIKNRFEILDL